MCHHHLKYFKNRLDKILCNLRPYVHLWRIWSLFYPPAEDLSNLCSTRFPWRTLPAELVILMAGITAIWMCISASLWGVIYMWVAAVFGRIFILYFPEEKKKRIKKKKIDYLLEMPDEECWAVVSSLWVTQPLLQLLCFISSLLSLLQKVLN